MSITWVVIFILCYFRGIHNWYLDKVSACSLYKELIWSNKFQKYANYLWQYSLRYSISCYKGWSGQLDKDNWCFSLKLYINRWCQNIPREHCRFRACFVVDFYCFDRELGSKSFQNSLQETNWYFENKTK